MEFEEYKLSQVAYYKNEKISTESINIKNYISTENMLSEKRGIQNANKLPETKSVKKYEMNDILISNIRPYFKKIWFSNNSGGASNYVIVIDTLNNIVVNDYLYYYLSQDSFFNYMTQTSKGTKMPRGDKEAIMNYVIKVPDSIHLQKRIADFGKSIDKKIEINKKIIANLEELSQALFKHWFVDFEFPDENGNPYKSSGGEMIESELGRMPKGWSINPLENIMAIKSGKRPSRKSEIENEIYNIPIIGASKIMGYTDNLLYDEKILVMGRVGTHGIIQKYYGRTWPSDNTFVIKSDYFEYVFQYLKIIDYKSLNRGSTQPLLSQKDIKKYSVKSPDDITLVKEFEDEVSNLNQLIKIKNVENEKLISLRDTLLPKLMSGELEIPEDVEVDEGEL
ncbi:restriction endonuclease subunit S [Staphylococcus simulans]|uniref:restriction endonuclease subunit S n=1 Tax=Staphylococcus simulans TaxID=1286 RepID=UPI001A8F341C|nr:restriction endonuclease subunit S [Staphylococcus simulans]MBO0387429.1 restriction endonuclease subunit S [Staphylococcus simulans]